MRNVVRNLPHYGSLFGILFVGALGFVFFSYDRVFQMGVALAVAISYVSWGIIHHYIHHDLTFAVLVEYLAVAILGLVMVFSLLVRA